MTGGPAPGGSGAEMTGEFDVLAGWTADAVIDNGGVDAVPAACRGSAGPAALEWLGRACGLSAGSVLLDVGAGTGGPSAFAVERFGVSPLLLEPMPEACRGARRMFGLPVVTASGEHLPLPDDAFDLAWCLGVLCTTTLKAEILGELRRVLQPGAALGLYVLLSDRPPAGAPEGNSFPSWTELEKLLSEAGFSVVVAREAASFPAAGSSWERSVHRVDEAVEAAHSGDGRLAQAREQERRLGVLFDDGSVTDVLVHAVVPRSAG